jgi:hypothetical protein
MRARTSVALLNRMANHIRASRRRPRPHSGRSYRRTSRSGTQSGSSPRSWRRFMATIRCARRISVLGHQRHSRTDRERFRVHARHCVDYSAGRFRSRCVGRARGTPNYNQRDLRNAPKTVIARRAILNRCPPSADQKPISLSARSGGMSSPVDDAFTKPSDFIIRTVMNPKSNSDSSWLVRRKCG